ncbi:hypothetical protein [Rhizobium sp. NFACC06-2]|uniref:hypothetical protein n=1 Tax=Rhizobium sp. NFACC06-2 TaxID=1566264 RepID=UPI0008766625|nr:hypothetical protein [Rhizobium sp. NFACC06-2]SCY89849.1 TolB amino-terminal domain-containing protein [Rhizobium sp. NFACC06-2]
MDLKSEPAPSLIRRQMEVLRTSRAFTGSDRLFALLEFVVEETLAGRGRGLREAVIGNAVYQRDPPYDPRVDSTVRVEIRRLRKKLEEYFCEGGANDPVVITIPVGSYIPVFGNEPSPSMASEAGQARRIFKPGQGTIIVVLPIRSFAASDELRECADHLTEELIYALGSEPGISVPSRTTTYTFAGDTKTLAELAADFGADAVVQGTLVEHAGAIRVTLEISDSRGIVVSSDRFEGDIEARTTLPERIATTLVSRVRFDSTKMRMRQISPGPSAVDSHSKIYRARQLLDKQTPEHLREALVLFTQVADAAPDYARGHSGMADCYCDLFRLGIIDHDTAHRNARDAVTHALEIDPESVEAHTALATIQAWLERDRKAAEESFQTALALGRSARAACLYGTYLTIIGSPDEAERMFREARRIEPFSQQQDIGEAVSRFQARRFDLLSEAESAIDRRNKPLEAAFYLALGNHFAGKPDSARQYGGPLNHLLATNPQIVFADAEIEAWLGEPERALRVIRAGNPKASHFAHASLASAVGDAELVYTHLNLALDRQELPTVWLRTDIRFDAFRSTSEFKQILARLDALRLS